MPDESTSGQPASNSPEPAGARVTAEVKAGLGMPRLLFGLVVGAAVLAAVLVGAALKWSPAAIVVTLVLSALAIAVVSWRSQRDLRTFKKEHGRWPRADEVDSWNREMHGRREKAKRVAAAATGASAAEQSYKQRVAQSERGVETARQQHASAVKQAQNALAAAEAAHAAAVAQATAGLEAWRSPGPGTRIAAFKGIELLQHEVRSRRGNASLLGAQIALAGNFLTIQANGLQEVLKLAQAEIPLAGQFASQFMAAASAEGAFQQQRPTAIPAAEQYLQYVTSDTAAIYLTRAAVANAEGDAGLLATIVAAESNLAAVKADTAAVDAAQSALRSHQESAIDRPDSVSPATWRPRAANAGVAFACIVLIAALVGTTGAIAAAPPARPTASAHQSTPVPTLAPTSEPPVVATTTPLADSPSPKPTPTSTQTPTPAPAKTPVPTPTPVQFVVQGQGSKVVPIDIPKGNFRVSWAAQGNDNFQVEIIGSAGNNLLFVNEIPPDPASGQFFVPSPGGSYNFQITAATLSWQMTFTQILGPADPKPVPTASEIKLSGQNSTISDPIYLVSGNYKISWTSQGTGNFVVKLHWGDSGERLLVNEIPPNPASGETAFDSGGGYHLLEIEAPNQQWTITLTPL